MLKKAIPFALMLMTTGCSVTTQLYTTVDSRKGFSPQSKELIAKSEAIGAKYNSPVLIQIFKEEHELDLWRMNENHQYVLINRFEICRFSGDLGPKLKQGDRQAPEGIYSVSSEQLNYHSVEYLSFDTGYPNAYDRAHGRTGASLMVHGGCSSAGCYAINDAPMQDLFAAVRDSLKAGQQSVQLQIYPFRMTTMNMLQYRENKNLNFWNQLKVVYDKFEQTKQEVRVAVIDRKYVVK